MNDHHASLRADVRSFIADHASTAGNDSWMRGADPKFSAALGERGWVGMTVPMKFGGAGRTYVERLVVTEELLRAGAPVAAHWIADRQIVPILLTYASAELRDRCLPGICRGTTYFCVGISEPDVGSDVSAVSFRAERTRAGWVLNGRKVWTTNAHLSHFMYLLARSERDPQDRHHGLTEFIVPMDADGIEVRPIRDLARQAHFNEVLFEDVRVGDDAVVGAAHKAWGQIVRQLDYERSGPERFLSSYLAFSTLASSAVPDRPDQFQALGEVAADIVALRRLCREVARTMDEGSSPGPLTALVKERGNVLEQRIAELGLTLSDDEPAYLDGALDAVAEVLPFAPAFTLRGGATQILRTIVARRLLGVS